MKSEKSYTLKSLAIINAWGQRTDISSAMQNITIKENIFSMGTRGVVSMMDDMGLIEMLPMFGEERLELEFHTTYLEEANPTYKKTFNIFRIDQGKQHRGKSRTYNIHFISPEVEINNNIKLSKAYKEKTSDEIVEDIWSNISESEINVESCISSPRFIIPYWSPFKAIQWMNENSVGTMNDYNDFVLYEDRDGWNWRTIRSLMKGKINQTLNYVSYRENYDVSTKNIIEDIKYPRLFDTVQSTKDGYYAQQRMTYSLIDKKTEKEHTILDSGKYWNLPHLPSVSHPRANSRGMQWEDITDVDDSGGLMFGDTDYYDNLSSPMADYSFIGNDYETIYQGKHQNRLIRKQLLSALSNNTTIVTVPGSTAQYIGSIVDLNIPSMRDTESNKNMERDMLNSGKHLVTGITHNLNGSDYTVNLEIRSDSTLSEFATR